MARPRLESAPARRALASNPHTPARRLSALAADSNLAVRRAAAANPSTPASTLKLLEAAGAAPGLAGAAQTPRPLQARSLENLAELGPWARRLAAAHPDAGPEQLDALAQSPEPAVRAAVARNPRSGAATLDRLLLDADSAIRAAAAAHPRAPKDRLQALEAAGANPTLDSFQAPRPLAPDELRRLAEAGPFGRRLAARHPDTPADLLAELAAGAATRFDLAFNPAATAEALAALADAERPQVSRALATHPSSPLALLRHLASSPDARLREAVAERADLPGALRTFLALDGSSAVRAAVLASGSLDDEARHLLRRLGAGDDLQSFVSPDPTLAADELRRLAEPPTAGFARRLAARHPSAPADLLSEWMTDADPTLRQAAAAHPAAPASLLQLLVAAGSSPDLQGIERPKPGAGALVPGGAEWVALAQLGPWARRLAAAHPGSPADLVARLAADADATVRRAAARHPALSEGAMQRLAADEAPDIRWALARRTDLSAATLSRFASDPLPALRMRAAADPRLPADLHAALRVDPDADVRAAASASAAEREREPEPEPETSP